MIALLLLACDLESGVDTKSSTEVDSADTAEVDGADAAEIVAVARCLADGGTLVERGATASWSAGLADLEVGADGDLLAMSADGHLLQTAVDALDVVQDLGTFGTRGAVIDRTGDELLVRGDGVSIGRVDQPTSLWLPVSSAWGDAAVSPDGAEVTWTYAACGVASGVVDMGAGTLESLDLGSPDLYPLAIEYLEDGRLAVTTGGGEGTGLLIEDGGEIEGSWSFEDSPTWYGVMEALGSSVALPTTASGDPNSQIVRVDVDSGATSTVSLPFRWVTRIAMDPDLVYAMDYDGHLAVSDGVSATDLGTVSGAVDIVADPEGAWLALAGGDGAIHVYGCE